MNNVVTPAVTAVLIAFTLAGCTAPPDGPGSSPASTSQAPSASPAAEPETGDNLVSEVFGGSAPVAGSLEGTQSSVGSGPSDASAAQGGAAAGPADSAGYWADDWCHYYVASDGVTYGDNCVRAVTDAAGTIVPNLYMIYRFDNTRAGNLGDAILELDVGQPEWTIFRDLTDPMYDQVEWTAVPSGQEPTAETFWAAFKDGNGGFVWYTVAQITAMASGAQQQSQYVPSDVAPAWDPAVVTFSYHMLNKITNSMLRIPGA